VPTPPSPPRTRRAWSSQWLSAVCSLCRRLPTCRTTDRRWSRRRTSWLAGPSPGWRRSACRVPGSTMLQRAHDTHANTSVIADARSPPGYVRPHVSVCPERHLDRFSRFGRTRGRDQHRDRQTDRQTDHACCSNRPHDAASMQIKKVKAAHTRLPSVGFRS